MKKILLILLIFFSVFITSCGNIGGNNQNSHKHSFCNVCGKCTDPNCDGNNKCEGHIKPQPPVHTHTLCNVCGKCTDINCDGNDKCTGHSEPEPPVHTHTFCDVCGKCTDINCDGNDKCEGHNKPQPPVHTHTLCEVCGKCIASDCDGNDICTGHNTPPSIPEGEINILNKGTSFETIYFEWEPLEGINKYHVYCNDIKVDQELVRFYQDYYRCDILGLTNKNYTVKVVPVYNNQELSNAATVFYSTPEQHVREGFAFVNGTSSGAYNDDGTLKSDARVIYVTDRNKDTITLRMKTGSSSYEDKVGIQNILLGFTKGYETKPLCIRFIGNITDPAVLEKGDLLVDFSKKFKAGLTIEGVGNDATFNGFGIRLKNCSNVEIRNIGFMNTDSDEGDNVSLQQDNDHIWVHNCDLFYGKAGGDADQAKGDGALDVKKSTYITISYNHYFDSGKCNLQGMTSESTENYITYHHNWYDHSDSRHPRIRTCTVHIYNNYYDGNSKYGVGSTMGSSVFVENNYFRNCKNPILTSLQGTDIKDGQGTFSGENGGVVKAFGNIFIGGNTPITYSINNSSFDFYDAATRNEIVPTSVKALVGGTTYNNFDTSNMMYEYNVQDAETAKENVMKYAGRVQGGDFKWNFTDADDSSYAVNTNLQKALTNYSSKLILDDYDFVNEFITKINSLPTNLTLSHQQAIIGLYNEYLELNESTQKLITNSNKLINAYETILNLEVEDLINKIDSLDINDKTTAKSLNEVYLSLTKDQQAKVTNYSKLENALGEDIVIPTGTIVHNFHEQGKESSFFTINGNLSTSKGTITYNGLTLTQCLKMESSTNITFNLTKDSTITLVFNPSASIKIDGTKYTSTTNIIVVELSSGTHTITKADSTNLYYIVIE